MAITDNLAMYTIAQDCPNETGCLGCKAMGWKNVRENFECPRFMRMPTAEESIYRSAYC